MAECECNIAAAFPISEDGIVSANLRINTQVIITSERLVLTGPAIGDLSITGYGDFQEFNCPGRAGVSYEWVQRYDCINDKVYFVPRGGERAFIEGNVSSNIKMTLAATVPVGFSVSASSGPHAIYLSSSHQDGYDFSYTGRPLAVDGRDTNAGSISTFLGGASLYLVSFNWEQTPPNIPNVSYSFIFANM